MSSFQDIKHELVSKLGNLYFENENCLLFCLDTVEAQKKLDHALFNTIITSPPYNIGKEYEQTKAVSEYVDWSTQWISDAANLLQNNGALLLNVGYLSIENKARALPIPYLLWDKIPLYLNQEIIWNYSAGVACKHYLSPRNEKILWYVKDKDNYTFNLDPIRDTNVKYPNSKRFGKPRVNTLGKNPSDVWEIAKITTGANRSSPERTSHPCQFPLDLIDRLVLGFTNEDDIVFDPFIGSGTTFVSCIKNNRFCIGFEIKEEYCEICRNRVMGILSQVTMF